MREMGIAMIGTGFMAKAHSVAISSYPKMHWPPVAMPVRQVICSREAARARESAARFGYAASSADYREAVCRPDVELVMIVTENDTHARVALAAMEARKHVLCEKPLARNVQEAQLMCDMARKTGVKTMVAFNYRRPWRHWHTHYGYHPLFGGGGGRGEWMPAHRAQAVPQRRRAGQALPG